MKTLNRKLGTGSIGLGLLLSACNGGGGGGGAASGGGSGDSVPITTSPSPSVSPSITASPSPSPSVSASPSPSPSASPYAYSGGTGTMADPYIVSVAQDVVHIQDHLSAYYWLNQSINMSSITMQTMGDLSGTIYGNNFEIDNLTITEPDTTTAALFSTVSGTIVNLKVYNVTVSGQGYATGFAGNLTGLISHCAIAGIMTSPFGGNGFNTGTGNPSYVTKAPSGTIATTTQNVMFNGNHVSNTW